MSEERNSTDSPEGWNWTKLGDVVERMANGTTESQNKNGEGVPVSRIETISDGSVDLDKVRHIADPSQELVDKYRLRKGDILLSHINTGLHLCKTGLFDHDRLLLHGMNLVLLRPEKEKVLPRFLDYLIDHYRRSGVFLKYAQHAVNQSSINQKKLSRIEVPLPPLPEQRRIVAKIEELFSNLDAGMDDLQTAQRQLERYRLSVLQAAVEGRLTADWRRTHDPKPADALLERILDERRKQWEEDYRAKYEAKGKDLPKYWRNRYSEPDPIDGSNSVELPTGWTRSTLEQITVDKRTGLVRAIKDQANSPDGGMRPYIRMQHYDLMGRWNENDLSYVEVSEEELDTYELLPGDLIFNTRNSFKLVGKTAVWPGGKPGFVYNNNLLRLRFVPSVSSRWIGIQMQSPQFQERIRASKSATTSICAIYQKDLFPQRVAIPPLAEQKEIVAEVERLLSVTDDAAATVKRERTRAERLRQSILKQAFSGQLVPHEQDATVSEASAPAQPGEQIEMGL